MKTHFTPNPSALPGLRRATSRAVVWPRVLLLLLLLLLGLLGLPARAQSFSWDVKATNKFQQKAVPADQYANTYVIVAFTGTMQVFGSSYTSFGELT